MALIIGDTQKKRQGPESSPLVELELFA